MRNICSVLLVVAVFFLGCTDQAQKEESRVMDKPEVSTINLGTQGMFYPSVNMLPFKGFVAIKNIYSKTEKSSDANLYCFDMANAKIAWKKVIEQGYHGKLEYAGEDDKVFVKLDGKLTCLDLFTGKT
ncbi:MAG: PQQ-like beta-propeller repeat protein, partial [Caldiserica bacterium]|nr:PQQ-like beta-propeller repeat protein [Caldisericota bacterium]